MGFKQKYNNISQEQARDTGMAMLLIALIFLYFFEYEWLLLLAIGLLLLNMIWPKFYKPVAVVWFGFSHIMGFIVSKIILSLVYFLMVFPVGFFRKLIGKDALLLGNFKKGTNSVFVTRNHQYTKEDIEKVY